MDDRNGSASHCGITIIHTLRWRRDKRLRPQTCRNGPKPRDRPQATSEASHCRTEYGHKVLLFLCLSSNYCTRNIVIARETMCECPSLRPSKDRRKDVVQRKRHRENQGALAGGRPIPLDGECESVERRRDQFCSKCLCLPKVYNGLLPHFPRLTGHWPSGLRRFQSPQN